MSKAAEKWNKIYQESNESPMPCRALIENAHLLPNSGDALDLASGIGGNALFLARHGLNVLALDISIIAIQKLKNTAQGLNLTAKIFDLDLEPLPKQAYDVITISRFLDRSLIPSLLESLRPSGLLIYQTYIQESIVSSGPKNPDYRLKPNELLNLFASLRLIAYREEGKLGDLTQGFRNEAFLIGQKLT